MNSPSARLKFSPAIADTPVIRFVVVTIVVLFFCLIQVLSEARAVELAGWSPQMSTSGFNAGRCKTVALGDVNGDGQPDLICPYDYGRAKTGTFVQMSNGVAASQWTTWSTPTSPGSFAVGQCKTVQVGDVNGDGKADLICPYNYGSKTKTFVQISSGATGSGWTAWSPETPSSSFAVGQCQMQAGDVNGDGKTDLVCSYDYSGTKSKAFVQFSSGATASGWTAWSPEILSSAFQIGQCRSLKMGDVNGDGNDDLICPYDYGGAKTRTFVQFSSGAAASEWTAWSPVAAAGSFAVGQCKTLEVGDVNGDGRSDLICPYDYSGRKTRTFVQFSSGATASGWTAWSAETPSSLLDIAKCQKILASDVNGDSARDLVCLYDDGSTNARLRPFVQLSSGDTASGWTVWPPTTSGFVVNQCQMQAGDVDGDGGADLICAYDYGGAKTRTFVQFSSAATAGTWTAWSPLAAPGTFAIGQCTPMRVTDLDGDGKADLDCTYDYGGGKTAKFAQMSMGTTASEWTPWPPPEEPATPIAPAVSAAEMTEQTRSGAFLIPGPTPQCDGPADWFADMGDVIADGAAYVGERTIKGTLAIDSLMKGDPGALFDEINAGFADLTTVAEYYTENLSPLALQGVLIDVLPAGEFTDFMTQANDFGLTATHMVNNTVIDGLNPAATIETLRSDLKEILTDYWKVMGNLDDPRSAGSEFLNLHQKWTGLGALSYMVTEGNPMDGLKKSLSALHRQVELVTTYAGPKGEIAGVLLSIAMAETKKGLDSMPDSSAQDKENKKATALLAAAFASEFTIAVTEPGYNPADYTSTEIHPLYKADITQVDTEWMGNDHNSGGKFDWGMSHPKVEDKPGCISLGDHAYKSGHTKALSAVCGVASGRGVWWTRPVDYKLVWGDNCSGGTHDRSIWQPVCSAGYTSVGFVASGGSYKKPLPNRIACLKNSHNLMGPSDGLSAGLSWIANDDDSGAKFDVTVFNRKFLGMDLAHAVNRKIGQTDRQAVRDMKVLVGVPDTGPAFYTIQQASNGRYLDVYTQQDEYAEHGNTIDRYSIDKGSLKMEGRVYTALPSGKRSQQWVVKHLGTNLYTIQNAEFRCRPAAGLGCHANQPMVIDTNFGDLVFLHGENPHDSGQPWIIGGASGGLGGLHTVQKVETLEYLDAHEGSNFNTVVTRGRQGNQTQQWVFNKVDNNF